MMEDVKIPGGYILLARKILLSGIMDKPPLFLKMWTWMLLNASFKDHGDLRRGQLFTSINRMKEALSHKVGYRLVKPSDKGIRSAYEFLMKGGMIGIMRGTHGMVITILNYDIYQNFRNYEGHNEGFTGGMDEGIIPRKKAKKENKCSSSSLDVSIRLSEKLVTYIQERDPNFKPMSPQKWPIHIDRMIRIDRRDPADIEAVIEWCQHDLFWQNNILSTEKLREKYTQLFLKMGNGNGEKKEAWEI